MNRWLVSVLFVLLQFRAFAVDPSADISAHDPSRVIQWKNTYWFFSTGPGIRSAYSTNAITWQRGPKVFEQFPAWIGQAVPENKGDAWAPDIIRLNNQFYLYYSISTLGSRRSVIGLATNPTLDPADPNYHWKDQGLVIQTGDTNDFNAIDPAIFQDSDQSLWMVFGSYWSGIKLQQLDPRTGKLLSSGTPPHALAWNDSIEASYLHKHNGYYYLFVNWDSCCRGVESRYNMRLGRSRTITGPYLDRDGVDMLKGGGSLFLAAEGRYIGPGHASIFSDTRGEWLSYHFYDGNDHGTAKINVRPLTWKKDWPVVE